MEVKILQQLGMRSHRTVRASRTCKSGMNNAAREIEHPFSNSNSSLQLLTNEANSKQQNCRQTKGPLSKPHSVSAKPFLPLPCQKAGKGLCVSLRPLRTLRFTNKRSANRSAFVLFLQRKERRERKETQRLLPVIFICLRRKRRILTSTLQLQLLTPTLSSNFELQTSNFELQTLSFSRVSVNSVSAHR